MRRRPRCPHPLQHHPSFRAIIAAAPALAELASRVRPRRAHTGRLPLPPPDTPDGPGDDGPDVAEVADATDLASGHLVTALALACSDLTDGFAAPPASRQRRAAHQRAWITVRKIDRAIASVARRRLAPPHVVRRAQRAIDRADVLIGALLPG